jgi:hypothetical protein
MQLKEFQVLSPLMLISLVINWGRNMLAELPAVKEYLKKVGRDWDNYQKDDFDYFEKQV